MKILKNKYPIFIFPLIAALLMYEFLTIPPINELDTTLIVFLCLIAVIEKILIRYYTTLWFSYFSVVLGLLIFDINSIFYSLFYFGTGFIFMMVKNKGFGILHYLPVKAVGIIAIILGNEFYNMFLNQTFFIRYLTFLFLLILSIILANLYSYLEYKVANSNFISTFLPTIFKVLIIFPILSIYNYFNFFMITMLFIAYLLFLNFCQERLLSVSEIHVQELINNLKLKHQLDIFFMELGSIKGVYYPKKNIIAIDEKLDYPEQLQTIIHEYLHHRINKKTKYHFIFDELIITLLEGIYSWIYILKAKRGVSL